FKVGTDGSFEIGEDFASDRDSPFAFRRALSCQLGKLLLIHVHAFIKNSDKTQLPKRSRQTRATTAIGAIASSEKHEMSNRACALSWLRPEFAWQFSGFWHALKPLYSNPGQFGAHGGNGLGVAGGAVNG